MNRKRRLERECDESTRSSVSTISPKTPTMPETSSTASSFLIENKTQQPLLGPSQQISPVQTLSLQPVQTQINSMTRPTNTFQLLSNPILSINEPNSFVTNTSNLIASNNQTIDFNDKDQLKQMLFFQSFMIVNLMLNNK